MGGTGIAKDVVLRALSSGKHVVTANKALIAEHLGEIQKAIGEAEGSPSFAYEAAVCGGEKRRRGRSPVRAPSVKNSLN